MEQETKIQQDLIHKRLLTTSAQIKSLTPYYRERLRTKPQTWLDIFQVFLPLGI